MKMRHLAILWVSVIYTASHAQSFQCRSDAIGVRNVVIQGHTMTVVNPKTPAIVFRKQATSEVRGSITKTTTDAWELYAKEGIGQLTNLAFGEKYTCIQTGS